MNKWNLAHNWTMVQKCGRERKTSKSVEKGGEFAHINWHSTKMGGCHINIIKMALNSSILDGETTFRPFGKLANSSKAADHWKMGRRRDL